jgi:hypothetical protein
MTYQEITKIANAIREAIELLNDINLILDNKKYVESIEHAKDITSEVIKIFDKESEDSALACRLKLLIPDCDYVKARNIIKHFENVGINDHKKIIELAMLGVLK